MFQERWSKSWWSAKDGDDPLEQGSPPELDHGMHLSGQLLPLPQHMTHPSWSMLGNVLSPKVCNELATASSDGLTEVGGHKIN